MTKLYKRISFGLSFFALMVGVFSCHHKKKDQNNQLPHECSTAINQTLIIDYANDCTIPGACTFTFPCTGGTQMATSSSFKSTVKNLTGKLGFGENFKAATSAQLTISSITTVGTPALLQNAAGPVTNTTWFSANSPLECTIDDVAFTVTCVNFAPLADHFTMVGSLSGSSVNLDVTINTSGVPIAAVGVDVCGRFGVADSTASHYTTEQRMYDCSKRVTDFAGIGNGTGAFTAFNPGNPDPNWFLVNCYDANIEHCSWLTPVVRASLATTTSNEYLSTVNGTQGALTSTLVGNRFLWSGLLTTPTTTFNFFEANGRNPWNIPAASTSPGQYDFYDFANTAGGADIAFRNAASNAQMCAPSSAGCTKNIVGFEDSVYNGSSAVLTSICERQTGVDPTLIAASPYVWQMPSYPVVMMITGGNNGYCESGQSGYDAPGQHAFCLSVAPASGSSYLGFRATDPIPFFQTVFWSSSVSGSGNGWFFYPDGSAGDGNLDNGSGVRCVSPL